MSKLSTILKAEEYQKALDNYINWVKNTENRSSKRLKGGDAPVARPRRRIALRLFGKELKTDQYLAYSVSRESYDKLKDKISGRAWINDEKLAIAETMKGVKPAKVILFEPDSNSGAGARYKESAVTKLHYVYRPGKNYSMAFGPKDDNEEFAKAAIALKTAVGSLLPESLYKRVSITPEYIP